MRNLPSSFAILSRLTAAVFAFALASCGSGGVSGPAPVVDPSRITILPSTATLYSGLSTAFVISGGTGSYIVSSSDQAVIPVSGPLAGSTLTVTPNPVLVDTAVTLTVRDTGTTPLASATVTVRPGTINNDVQVIPTSTQGGTCAPAICSGGDALVIATLAQGGNPLPSRAVRFEVVSGDFRFISTLAGSASETLEVGMNTLTDELGKARARIRILANAPNQTAILQVTDLVTGAFQRTTFVIAQSTGSSPGFFATPASVTFTGPNTDNCASTGSADVFVFGGRAPYTITTAGSAFNVTRGSVSTSGGSFSITPRGECVAEPGLPITITDSSGRTTTVLVSNLRGTQTVPALAVAPSSVTLSSCDSIATITAVGGTGNYFANSGSGAVVVNGVNPFGIQRTNPSGPTTSPLNVGISDGRTTTNVTVNLTGAALGSCPSSALAASPAAVVLTDCSSSAQVTVSGGSGSYVATSSSGSVRATVSGSGVAIRRVDPSAAFGGAAVTISDGISSVTVNVTGSGNGANTCPTSAAPANLVASPTQVTLSDCTSSQQVAISNGAGFYNVTANDPGILVTSSGNIVTIRRRNPSGTFSRGDVSVVESVFSNPGTVIIPVYAAGLGAGACSASPPFSSPFAANPTAVTLSDCSTVSPVALTGGSGSYTASSNSGSVSATEANGTISIRRVDPSPATAGAIVTASDGSSTIPITVSTSPTGAGACPAPFSASATTVDLSGCFDVENVTISGGIRPYSVIANHPSLSATLIGSNTVRIQRVASSPGFAGSQTVSVYDSGTVPLTITVTTSGTGGGGC